MRSANATKPLNFIFFFSVYYEVGGDAAPRQTLYGNLRPLTFSQLYPNSSDGAMPIIEIVMNFTQRFQPIRLWEIRIAQIPFSQRAPVGCLQYHAGTDGIIQVRVRMNDIILSKTLILCTVYCILHFRLSISLRMVAIWLTKIIASACVRNNICALLCTSRVMSNHFALAQAVLRNRACLIWERQH